jgi:hypothetical protein
VAQNWPSKASGIEYTPKNAFCTMKSLTNYLKLPSTRGGYKWPKLSEAYAALLNKELVGAHDAMVDVSGLCEIVQFCVQQGIFNFEGENRG